MIRIINAVIGKKNECLVW